MGDCVSYNDAEGNHATKGAGNVSNLDMACREKDGLQGPLGNGNGNEAGLSKAMLDCCLEGVGTAEL